MQEIFYLILRQIRRPALILLASYTIAILGIVFIPGNKVDGEINYLTIFQAFYWVSYTATTIGFGELPFEFSETQRIWVAFSIYYTVPSWFYAIGKIIALLQDSSFQYWLSISRFRKNVSNLNSKFCIICGCGEAGLQLTYQFLREGFQCIVIEKDPERLRLLSLDFQFEHVLSIVGDASDIKILEIAGIKSSHCQAVLAITDNESVNLKVALSARLLASEHRHFKIVCRTYTRNGNNHAKALTADIIINTNQILTKKLILEIRRPNIAKIFHLLLGKAGEKYDFPPYAPVGRWLICGSDALAKTLKRYLDYEGIDCILIDPDLPNSRESIKGLGNEAVTLRAARIDRAQALVVARNSDSDNLAIALTAKSMQANLFVIGKQNKSIHQDLFAVAGFDRVMAEAELIVNKAFIPIANPLLGYFLNLLNQQPDDWGKALLKRIEALAKEKIPFQMSIRVDEKNAPALINELATGRLLRLQTLWTVPNQAQTLNEVIPLLIKRKNQEILIPDAATIIQKGDKILLLFADKRIARRIYINLFDEAQLHYAIHGKEKIRSALLSYLKKRFDK